MKIGSVEFESFVLRGVKAPLAIATLKQWAILNSSSSQKGAKKIIEILKRVRETLTENERQELDDILKTLSEQKEQTELSDKLKTYLNTVIQNNPESFEDLIDLTASTQLEQQNEKIVETMTKSLEYCLEALGKSKEDIKKFSVKDQFKLIFEVLHEKENIIDYDTFFFAIPELNQFKAEFQKDLSSSPSNSQS